MKKMLCAGLGAVFMMAAQAGDSASLPTWTTGTYEPAEWTAAKNLLSSATVADGELKYYTEGARTPNQIATLTDGQVPPKRGDYTGVVGIKGGGITWTLDESCYIDRLNIYSIWGDGGRDGIAVDKVLYKTATSGDTWIEVVSPTLGNAVSWGVSTTVNPVGALVASLTLADGSAFMEGATAIKVVFSDNQEWGGDGYVEVEAVGKRLSEMDVGAKVTFVDYDGQVLKEASVALGTAAVPPEDPVRDGYTFIGWDGDMSSILHATTFTAQYHKWCTVVFKDADGTQIGAVQTVEETKAAEAPDMSAKTFEGRPFLFWDGDPSAITEDVVFTAIYGALPDYVLPFLAAQQGRLPDGAIVWAGGDEDVWNSTAFCWVTTEGIPVEWQEGAWAVFPVAAEITLDGERTVSGLMVYGDVVLKGDALNVVAPAKIVYGDNASLRIEADVKGTSGLTLGVREQMDEIHRCEVEGALTAVDRLLFSNVKLSDVEVVCAHFYGHFGANNRDKIMRTDEAPGADFGIFHETKTDDEYTAQFQMYCSDAHNIIKLRLHQVGDDVWGQYLYSVSYCYSRSAYNPNGWKLGDDFDALVASNRLGDNYGQTMCDLELRMIDHLPTEVATTFAGDYGLSGGLTIDSGKATIDGAYAVKQPVSIAPSARLVFGPRAEAVLTNDGPSDKTNVFNADEKTYSGEVDICGKVRIPNVGKDVPRDLFGRRTVLNVRAGGELVFETTKDARFGFNRIDITCAEGGVVRLTAENALGFTGHRVWLTGGTMVTEQESTKNQYLIDATLSDGGILAGTKYCIGCYNAYVDTEGNITRIRAEGTKPSFITAETLLFGNSNGRPASTKDDEIVEFQVADVTGDAASDLIISSRLVKDGDPVLTVAEGRDADYRLFYALVKKGTGTLELNNEVDLEGSVTLQEGTLRLGEKASGAMGALVLTGDAELDVVRGAKMAFDDASALPWAEGATLNLTGEIGRKSIRFGTTANGLTSEQLAAIVVDGKRGRVSINDAGYLSVPKGFSLIVR